VEAGGEAPAGEVVEATGRRKPAADYQLAAAKRVLNRKAKEPPASSEGGAHKIPQSLPN
jgi:hypothetical protein